MNSHHNKANNQCAITIKRLSRLELEIMSIEYGGVVSSQITSAPNSSLKFPEIECVIESRCYLLGNYDTFLKCIPILQYYFCRKLTILFNQYSSLALNENDVFHWLALDYNTITFTFCGHFI